MVNIGIIGKGFVGNAVAYGFSSQSGFEHGNIRIYDKNPKLSQNSLEEVVNGSEFIFISVPTPSNKDGSVHLGILDDVLLNISKSKDSNASPIILIRSTIVPGSSRKFQDKYQDLRIVFNPEFLTERSANSDFISQNRYILGGNQEDCILVADLYRKRFGDDIAIILTDYESAELIKYMNNTFLATKVSFMNEMYLACKKIGANWDDCIEGFIRDERIGNSHVNVPGPDGKMGFGGSCFPKDIQAFIKFAKDLGINPNVLIGSWNTNLEVRKERDWELLVGRSVLNEDTLDRF